MLECRDIDTLMVDWLYRELDREQEGRFDAHLQGCARCQDELDALERTRAALRELPAEEPPSSISAILLHEAAKHAPSPGRAATAVAADDDEPRGLLGWLVGLLNPIVAHPAAAAVATLVLVAGIAGSLYLRGDHRVATPEVASGAPEPARAEAAHGMMRMPDEGRAADDVAMPAASEQAWNADLEGLDQGAEVTGEADGKLDLALEKKEVSKGKDANRQPLARPKAKAPPFANAVSGTDVLVDLDEAEESQKAGGRASSRSGSKTTTAKPNEPKKSEKPVGTRATRPDPKPSYDKAPPPPSSPEPGRYRVYKQDSPAQKAQAKREWTLGKQNQLDRALQLKRCRDAAKIANDILDRNPDYYYQKVSRSKSIKTCSGFVEAERKSRQQRRAKRKSKGASAPKQMKAAPRDEAVETAE